jgi:hypothetical protein
MAPSTTPSLWREDETEARESSGPGRGSTRNKGLAWSDGAAAAGGEVRVARAAGAPHPATGQRLCLAAFTTACPSRRVEPVRNGMAHDVGGLGGAWEERVERQAHKGKEERWPARGARKGSPPGERREKGGMHRRPPTGGCRGRWGEISR